MSSAPGDNGGGENQALLARIAVMEAGVHSGLLKQWVRFLQGRSLLVIIKMILPVFWSPSTPRIGTKARESKKCCKKIPEICILSGSISGSIRSWYEIYMVVRQLVIL